MALIQALRPIQRVGPADRRSLGLSHNVTLSHSEVLTCRIAAERSGPSRNGVVTVRPYVALCPDRRRGRAGQADQIGGTERDLEAAPARRHVHLVQGERGVVDDGRQPLALAERADAAADVTAAAL